MLLLTLAAACHNKSVPAIPARTEQPAPPPKAAEPALSPDMAAGKVIYTTSCIRCHDAKPVANWTVEEWKPILKSMVKKSKLDSAQTVQLTVYVNAFAKQ